MTTALSLLLFALGAILAFAVRAEPDNLDPTAVGVIFMIVSGVGFVLSVGREFWRDRMFEERVEQGSAPPMPLDHSVLVDRSAPIEAELYEIGDDLDRYPAAGRHDVRRGTAHGRAERAVRTSDDREAGQPLPVDSGPDDAPRPA